MRALLLVAALLAVAPAPPAVAAPRPGAPAVDAAVALPTAGLLVLLAIVLFVATRMCRRRSAYAARW